MSRGVDRHADLPTSRTTWGRPIVPHLGRKIEGHGQTRLAVVEQVPVPAVRLLRVPEARVLPHRPEAAAEHRRWTPRVKGTRRGNPRPEIIERREVLGV